VKRLAAAFLKIGVSIFLLWFALRGVDASRVGADIAHAQVALLAAALLVLALQPLLGALRWHIVMRALGAPIAPRQSLRLTYAGTFLNQVLPGGAGGDAARMWLAFREGHRVQHALNGVALDRMVGFVALLVAATLCVGALDDSPRLRALGLSLMTLAAAALAGLALVMLLDRLPAGLRRFRAVSALGLVAQDARRLLLAPRTAALLGLLSALAIANLCASLALFLQAFHMPLAPRVLALAAPVVILASSLPVSVGGWGTREAAMVLMTGALAAPSAPGIAASVAFGLASLLVSLPGVFFLYPAAR